MNRKCWQIIILIVVSLPVLISCTSSGSIGISGHFRKGVNENWTMEGGGLSRNANRSVTIDPPLTLLWKTDGTSAFTRTITVSDSIIYTTSKDARLNVFNLRTGHSIGKMKFNYSGMHGVSVNHHDFILALAGGKTSLISYNGYDRKYNFIKTLGPIENNPLIYDDFIYVATEKGVLYCLDYKDGNTNWSYTLSNSCHSSPALYLNAVLIACDDGTIVSLNRFRGTVNWSTKTYHAVLHPPVVDSQKIFISAINGQINCLNAETGKILWNRQLGDPDSCKIYSAPSAGHGYVFVGSANGSLYALSQNDGTLQWKFETKGAVSVTPVVTRNYVYTGSQDGYVYAVNIRTGQPEWSYKTSGRIKTNPVVYGRYLIVAAENKTLYVFQSPEKK